MRVYIWCDGAAMPNGGPAGAGYVVVGGAHLLGSEALGDATNNVAEYTAVRNALRAAADATTALPDRATAIKRVAFPPKRDSYPLGDRRSRSERPPEASAPAHRPGGSDKGVDVLALPATLSTSSEASHRVGHTAGACPLKNRVA